MRKNLLLFLCFITPFAVVCQTRDPNHSKDYANVFWNPHYTLFDLLSDEAIYPDNNVYKIWYSSNEDPTPHYKEMSVELLQGFTFYKFKSLETCRKWCDAKTGKTSNPIQTTSLSQRKEAEIKSNTKAKDDGKLFQAINGKYFAFSYYDDEKERPFGLMFQLIQTGNSSAVKNLVALSKWSKGTSYKGIILTLKESDTDQLVFHGFIKAKYADGDSGQVECELVIKLYDTQKYETWLHLPGNETVWGYCKTGTQAFAKEIYNRNIAYKPETKKYLSPVAFTDELSVMTYLNGKVFKSKTTGTEISIGYSSELGSYGLMINGRARAFNLTYTPLTSYKAVVKGMVLSTDDGGDVKVYVNSALHILENGGTIYFLKQ